MYFSLERRHNATFHPFGILRHHWFNVYFLVYFFAYLFTFLFTLKVLRDWNLDWNLKFGLNWIWRFLWSIFKKIECWVFVEYLLKFGLSEKYTKFENIFLMVLTNQLIYLVNVKNHEEDFFQIMCTSQKVRTLWFFHLLKTSFVGQSCFFDKQEIFDFGLKNHFLKNFTFFLNRCLHWWLHDRSIYY